MHKIYLTAVLLLALNVAKAKSTAVIDSIGVENNNGKKLIVHQAVAKDTYYSIARRYNVSPKDIMAYNDNKYLKVGVIIKVPTNIPFTSTGSNNMSSTAQSTDIIEHTVKAKENLNMLAEKYGTTINEIKALNNLTSSNLSIGQVIKIPAKNNSASTQAKERVEPPVNKIPETVSTPETNGDQTMIEHAVQPKEFLGKIAEKYGTTVEEIKKANNLTGNNLRIGQKLKIPATKNIEDGKVVSATEEQPIQTNKSKDPVGSHTVLKGESIFTIAKQYGITAYQIRKLNNLDDNTLSTGQVLKIPSDIVVDVPKQTEKPAEVVKEVPVSREESFIHTVVDGENIFSIAKKYSLTAYQIRTANKLKDNILTIGQKLVIPKPPQPKSVNDASKEDQEGNPDSTMVKDPKLRRDPSVYGLSQIEEKGTAVWIQDQDLDSSKMLVLHRTAPIGRVIKITNPMTNRTTFAKVVGKFTENESTKDVIIVMTKAVADSLGALDKRFFCNLTYSAQ
ncbi:LysM peptidoglycan-binding domain-containing protein [Pedobacter fastidiosus]|uniref:LysM peptidoglycan-binding domain-containing protein n=1 Tax=Pedobacter fastidiosus TaxID=2765361 RepID=A0ABR7KRW7_9SPHI|nr:LysM peptidoglycan-binding domain-containing protein [Pedobacter fastidiosus]MBC6110834.1 LysM peptidoglycan-binding domain-containing protein [Pedobacter fastidiosus]